LDALARASAAAENLGRYVQHHCNKYEGWIKSTRDIVQNEKDAEAEPRKASLVEPETVEQSGEEVLIQTQQVKHVVKVQVGDHTE